MTVFSGRDLRVSWIDTPIGRMVAIADETALCRLEFADLSEAEEFARLRAATTCELVAGSTGITASIERELAEYFAGRLTVFQTPCCYAGSPFQNRVWGELQKISFAHTSSYGQVARAIGRPTAFRAVAQANRTNPLAIIIPCHRVINSDGRLGGYDGGIERKQWLLDHEKRVVDGLIGATN